MIGEPGGIEVAGKNPGGGLRAENPNPLGEKPAEIGDPMARATPLSGNPGENRDQQISKILTQMGLPASSAKAEEIQKPMDVIQPLKTESQKNSGFFGWVWKAASGLFHALTLNLFKGKAAQPAG